MSDENEEFTGTEAEQIEKMREALDRYKKENKKFREQRDGYKKQIDEGVDSDETANKFKTRALRAEAKLRLQAEGIKDPDRLVKRMNFDGITINDDDEIEGMDDQIKELKTDFAELFDTKRRVGGGADGSTKGDPAPAKTDTERQLDTIFKRR